MPEFQFISVKQKEHSFRLVSMPAGLLTRITYSAVRRKDEEEGAVQRVLNNSRISGIKDFAQKVGDFPASIVLNWVKGELQTKDGLVDIPDVERSAQILDGQHRVAGIKAALEENPEMNQYEIPVAIYEGLDTAHSARIFVSINNEQRPAPKSLVFDLYGIAASDILDPAAIRANDIVTFLGEEGRPYCGWIKMPNQDRKKGGVALSTAVNALKPLVEEKGQFEQLGATELEIQKRIFENYFGAIREKYGSQWDDKGNALIYASGFIASIDFFRSHMFDYCKGRDSFEKSTISNVLGFDETSLILQQDVKGMGGSSAVSLIHERLVNSFKPQSSSQGFKV